MRSNEHTKLPECLAGDPRLLDAASAFTCIYKNYRKEVLTSAYHICHCSIMSEEIVQEVFIRLWLNKEQIREIRDIQSWLFMTTRNLSIDFIRKQKMEAGVFKEYSFIAARDMYVEESMSREMQRVMLEAVEQLQPQQRRVYQLKKFYGWRRDKIAQQLNISENTVKNHMQKAISSVRKYVKERVE